MWASHALLIPASSVVCGVQAHANAHAQAQAEAEVQAQSLAAQAQAHAAAQAQAEQAAGRLKRVASMNASQFTGAQPTGSLRNCTCGRGDEQGRFLPCYPWQGLFASPVLSRETTPISAARTRMSPSAVIGLPDASLILVTVLIHLSSVMCRLG